MGGWVLHKEDNNRKVMCGRYHRQPWATSYSVKSKPLTSKINTDSYRLPVMEVGGIGGRGEVEGLS